MRIAIVGAGSGYMPGVIRGLLHRAGDLAGTELACHDVDAGRLEVMTRLARNMFAAGGADLTATAHTDLKAALDGASYVFTTFRPGGPAARHLDESIPLRHGVVGQETAGPGGLLMALRSVPVLLEIAAAADPDAWIVNYTNPTNIVTDAVARHTGARIIGLCDQYIGDTEMWAELLGLPAEGLEADWAGLDHATWAQRLRLDGRELDLPAMLDDLEIPGGGATPWRDPSRMAELAKILGFLPNSYAKYYFFHDEVVEELRAKGTTRAQDVLAMLPGYHAACSASVLGGVGTDCGVYRTGLGVYATGRSTGAEAAALSAHLRGCAACRAELAELRGVADLLARSVPWPGEGREREGAGREPRTGASRTGLSGVCAYGARGPGRSR